MLVERDPDLQRNGLLQTRSSAWGRQESIDVETALGNYSSFLIELDREIRRSNDQRITRGLWWSPLLTKVA